MGTSSSADMMAPSALSCARFLPLPRPMPIIAVPAPPITDLTPRKKNIKTRQVCSDKISYFLERRNETEGTGRQDTFERCRGGASFASTLAFDGRARHYESRLTVSHTVCNTPYLTSAKSTLMSPGLTMMSDIPTTPCVPVKSRMAERQAYHIVSGMTHRWKQQGNSSSISVSISVSDSKTAGKQGAVPPAEQSTRTEVTRARARARARKRTRTKAETSKKQTSHAFR